MSIGKTFSKIFLRIAFILNGFAFLQGGISFLSTGKLLFGMIQIITAAFNFILFFNRVKPKAQKVFQTIIYFLNVLVAATIAWDYYYMGKKYIQYAWILVAIASVVALIIYVRKLRVVPDVPEQA